MAEILGFLSGVGMLAFIGALIVAFLLQMGWVPRDAPKLLGRSAAMVCGIGTLYLGTALLFELAVYGKLENGVTLDAVFHGPYMRLMLAALENPQGVGIVSMAFAALGFVMGKLCFGQYAFCGLVLAWGMTIASLFLLQLRLRKMTDDPTLRDAAFLLLCLPGSVFLLLPGFAPLCLLLCAVIFYLLGKRLKPRKIRLSPAAYGGLLGLCAVLSAAVVICAAEGRIG